MAAVPATALECLLKPHQLHCVVLLGRAFRAAYERFLVARTTHSLPMALLELRSSSRPASPPARRAAWVRSLVIHAPRAWHMEHGLVGPDGARLLPQDALGTAIRRGLTGLSVAAVGTPQQATALPACVRHLTWNPELGSTGCPGDWAQQPAATTDDGGFCDEDNDGAGDDDGTRPMDEEKEEEGENKRGEPRADAGSISLPPRLESLVVPYIPYASWGALPTTLRSLALENPGHTLTSMWGQDFDFCTLPRLQELRLCELTRWPLSDFAARAPGLRVLRISRCYPMFELLPGSLPAGLESLELANFKGTLYRGSLPAGLRDLRLHGNLVGLCTLPLDCLPDNLVQLDLRQAHIDNEHRCRVPQSAAPSRASLRTLRLQGVTGYDNAFWPHATTLQISESMLRAFVAPRAITSLDVPAFAYGDADLPAAAEALANLTALTLRHARSFVFAQPLPPKLRSLHFEGSMDGLRAVIRSATLTRLTLNAVYNAAGMDIAQLFPNLEKLAFVRDGIVTCMPPCNAFAWIAELPRLTSLKFDRVNLSKCGILDAHGDILGRGSSMVTALDRATARVAALSAPPPRPLPLLRTLSLGPGAFTIDAEPRDADPLLAEKTPCIIIRRIPANIAKLRIHTFLWKMCSADLRNRAQTVAVSQNMTCARFF